MRVNSAFRVYKPMHSCKLSAELQVNRVSLVKVQLKNIKIRVNGAANLYRKYSNASCRKRTGASRGESTLQNSSDENNKRKQNRNRLVKNLLKEF